MFGKKKKEKQIESAPKQFHNYSSWSDDIGFLFLIIKKKTAIIRDYFLKTLSEQLENNTYLKDDDISPLISNVVTETISLIADNYRNFLISNYFKNDEALISFITEEVTSELFAEAINTNQKKMANLLSRKKIQQVYDANKIGN